jgi:hypothetical protein
MMMFQMRDVVARGNGDAQVLFDQCEHAVCDATH